MQPRTRSHTRPSLLPPATRVPPCFLSPHASLLASSRALSPSISPNGPHLRNGRLAGAGFAGEQNGAAGNLALPDHLQDNAGGAAGLLLAHHALRLLPGLERIVQAEAADVRVRAYAGGIRKRGGQWGPRVRSEG